MPRALTRHDLWRGLQGLQTGSFIFGHLDGIDSKDQAAYFFEQIALISTLLLTVVYPSYQEAMSNAKFVEVQHAGLGLAWATVTTLGVHGCWGATITCVVNLVILHGISSDAQLVYYAKAAYWSLRMPWFIFMVGAWTTFLAWPIEGHIRNAQYDQAELQDGTYTTRLGQTLDEDEVSQAERSILWITWGITVAAQFWLQPASIFVTARHLRTSQIFSARDDEESHQLRASDAASQPSWFGRLDAGSVQELLNTYFDAFGSTPFGDPNPDHFLSFCLHAVRSRDHGSISYIDRRKIESAFEERIGQILQLDSSLGARVAPEPIEIKEGNGASEAAAANERWRAHVNAPPSGGILETTEDPEQKEGVLSVVHKWLKLREQADAKGAAELSADEITVKTPMGVIHGLKTVTEEVYTTPSSQLKSSTAVEATSFSPGVWTARRSMALAQESGNDLTLSQEWLVLFKAAHPDAKAKPLIQEVRTSAVQPQDRRVASASIVARTSTQRRRHSTQHGHPSKAG